jgi:hypothetical protein
VTAKARDPSVDLAQAYPVALAPHPFDNEPDAPPVVEPSVERAERRRLRWELDETEGGAEETAAAVNT